MLYRYAASGRLARWTVIALALQACERQATGSATRRVESVAAAARAPDTIVRRVVRRMRRASALQRVTQDVHPLRALAPLESLLVVRVYDQRGVELADVRVLWTLTGAGQGAALRVVDARTDTLGLSRAEFIPGATADTQHVLAMVDSVGRIDFGIVIPPATLQVRLSRPDVWSGDDVPVHAELRDVTGRELAGGHVTWASADTTVARIRTSAGARALVTGVRGGETAIVAWLGAGRPQGSSVLQVRPVISGAFVTLDGSTPPPMRLEVVSGAVREPLTVDAGRFGARIQLAPDASLEFIGTPATVAFQPVDVRIHAQRDVEGLRIVLVPATWRIDAGTYHGREIPIDANAALRRLTRGAAFWRLVPLSGTAPRRLLGWAESDLPLRIAFNRARSIEPITSADSIAFWNVAEQMERDLGMRLFAAAQMSDSVRVRVVPVEIGVQGAEGHTFISSGHEGNANDGVLLFRHTSTLRDSHVVTHELLHLIGFGHTNAWPTVSVPAGGNEPRLTAHDVAYVQLAMRLRRIQRETGARPGLPAAAP